MSRGVALRLFEGYGIELEYMLVSNGSLDVLPVSDRLLRSSSGRHVNDILNGAASWSNEFVLHVMEIKNNMPVPSLSGLSRLLQEQVVRINRLLAQLEGRLMPSGMHPWMEPARETRLWNHRNRKIYETYDRIFGCRTHGWANIQSMHLNISFLGDEELGRLHAAARLLLPLIPALAASSPVVEGKVTGIRDNRLSFYRTIQRLVPSVSGAVIPEAVFTRSDYKSRILRRMYDDIARYDTDGVLQHEWLNSRGAIPRFERSAMEIRLADAQECPLADVAVAAAIASALKAIVDERWASCQEQAAWPVEPLAAILDRTMHSGETAIINDKGYLMAFGYPESSAMAADVWRHVIRESFANDPAADKDLMKALQLILDCGTLSTRILKFVG
ncbi:MAG: glutamate-cysteine ligase family protein, partial [Nitrospirota bacterium]|nr:glutamate-cysteine ligase family protein [Nitrospirota bacterium]